MFTSPRRSWRYRVAGSSPGDVDALFPSTGDIGIPEERPDDELPASLVGDSGTTVVMGDVVGGGIVADDEVDDVVDLLVVVVATLLLGVVDDDDGVVVDDLADVDERGTLLDEFVDELFVEEPVVPGFLAVVVVGCF